MFRMMKKIALGTSAFMMISSSLASAQTITRLNPSLVTVKPILRLPPTCLSCPDLSQLPKFREGLSDDEKEAAVEQMDEAFQHLKDLPDVSPEILTSVDYWERLKPIEKEAILGHRFGDHMNWAAAAVVVAAAALAWDVYKDYRQTKWNPAELGFDKIRTRGSLDYMNHAAVRLEAVRSLQSRLSAFQGLSNVGMQLNY